MSQSLFNNSFQKLYIHTGGGANGKGLLFRLMYKCLGNYYIQTDSEFLSTSYVSGQANSTLYNTRGKRILAVSEPNASLNSKNLTAGFNISFIKILTGGDQISARELFMKQGATWSNQFTIHIQANDIPPIDKLDNGTRRRFITIEYPNTFTDKEGELNEFERKKDITLPEKLDMEEYYKTFIIMLINRTKDFEKMVIPNSIIETSTNYINSNNPLVDWISECCVLGDFKTKSSLLINNYNENTPKHQIDGKKLKKYFEALTTYNISFDKNNSLYKGIRLKTFDEKNDDPTITE
jgi:phage/plasmid-associated DNA primase